MTPPRKRQVRLIVSLTLAVLLASGLIYTSFAASDPALTPSQLLHDTARGRNVELTGTVVRRSIRNFANGDVDFRLADRVGDGVSVPVYYSGSVPPAFAQVDSSTSEGIAALCDWIQGCGPMPTQ